MSRSESGSQKFLSDGEKIICDRMSLRPSKSIFVAFIENWCNLFIVMNSSFLSTLLAVLSDEEDIPALPHDRLITSYRMGDPVKAEVTRRILLKLTRLQTLCFQVYETGEMPELDAMKQMASETGSGIADVRANSLGTQDDMACRIMMLERLMVEVVREAVPAECDKFEVQYYVHADGTIMRRPIERRRFLD